VWAQVRHQCFSAKVVQVPIKVTISIITVIRTNLQRKTWQTTHSQFWLPLELVISLGRNGILTSFRWNWNLEYGKIALWFLSEMSGPWLKHRKLQCILGCGARRPGFIISILFSTSRVRPPSLKREKKEHEGFCLLLSLKYIFSQCLQFCSFVQAQCRHWYFHEDFCLGWLIMPSSLLL
jgi:hypothetical protein